MRNRLIVLSSVGTVAGLLILLSRTSQGTGQMKENASPKPSRKTDTGAPATQHARANATGASAKTQERENVIIDDQGTDQFAAANVLKNIRDAAFDASDEKLALALGRPREEIEEWTSGTGTIDGDVVMKARGLAILRGVEI